MDNVGSISMFFQVLWIAFIALDFLDFIVGEFVAWEGVDFFHFDDALRDSIFPFFNFALKDEFISEAVSDNESSLSCNLVVDSLAVPLVD